MRTKSISRQATLELDRAQRLRDIQAASILFDEEIRKAPKNYHRIIRKIEKLYDIDMS